jgi:pseudouridine-5'-monophosphatase
MSVDAYLAQRDALQDALFTTVPVLPGGPICFLGPPRDLNRGIPGVERLVRHLEKHNVPMAIATSSSARKLALKLAPKPALFAPFAARIACADDVGPGRGKPCPDIWLLAARALLGRAVGGAVLAPTPAELAERARGLVFEDARPGVLSAKRAGMNGARARGASCA